MTGTEHLPVVFLMGPTASGKTALSLSLAKELDAEIISVDSTLVYRGLNIGSAKPTAEEQQSVAHHLIDVCDPQDAYSTARFCADASAAIRDIQARHKRPLLVGGTMLYFKALQDGIADMPDADESMREQLLHEAQIGGWPAMHEQLARVDAEAALRIHPNDPQRIQRALEVFRLTGTAMSVLQKNTHSRLVQPPLKFALVPDSRAWLHDRIERRFHQMLDEGFVHEVEALRATTGVHADLPAIRSVGYRQAWEHLQSGEVAEGGQPPWVDKGIAATRQLAKRQLTWLRGMDDVHCLPCDLLDAAEQLRRVCAVMEKQEIAS